MTTEESHFLYVFSFDEPVIKIGISSDPESRLTQLGCASRLKARYVYEFARRVEARCLEKLLHDRFKAHRTKSPFSLKSGDTEIFSDTCLPGVMREIEKFTRVYPANHLPPKKHRASAASLYRHKIKKTRESAQLVLSGLSDWTASARENWMEASALISEKVRDLLFDHLMKGRCCDTFELDFSEEPLNILGCKIDDHDTDFTNCRIAEEILKACEEKAVPRIRAFISKWYRDERRSVSENQRYNTVSELVQAIDSATSRDQSDRRKS
jgi:Meiotically up-regulated gene 113